MWREKYLFVFLACYLAKTDAKSSLTFVIDDTASMSNDIEQVKENTNLVFDAVLYSNDSQIDNFIIVTFNDPDNEVLTVTKDRATFKRALASISVHGGGDCPEYSMTGIEKALEVSNPSSYIYVFTDATAADYKELERVQNMAVSQQSQVVFLLTGHCGVNRPKPEYEAYYTISKATDGKVFHMEKSNVGEVLNYIAETIESKKTKLIETSLPPGKHDVKYKVDDTVKDTTIVLSRGDGRSEVKVFKPNGTEADTKTIVDIPSIKVLKVTGTETGNYTAKVDGKGETVLTVTAKTSFDFRHRFSPILNPSLDAMSNRPIAGVNSFIIIQLETPDDIKLRTIDIVDLDDHILMTFDAQVLDEKRKTYFAARFIPPINQFKIAINAEISRTGELIKRFSKPVESQKPELVKTVPKDPTVEILEGPKVAISNNESLKLTCKVKGYPQPTVVWEHVESRSEQPSTFSVIEPPYDYMSTLDIGVAQNGTYRCKAFANGVDASADVEVTMKDIFKIVGTPNPSYYIPYGPVKITISCKVNAYPPANVTWYFRGKKLEGDERLRVDHDKLTITYMRPDMAGDYMCELRNEFHRKVQDFSLHITEFERPVLYKNISKVTVLEGSDVRLSCKLLAGKPKASIFWRDINASPDEYYVDTHDDDSTIVLPKVKRDHTGVVKCEARNVVGLDHHKIKLNVEYPPTIRKDKNIVVLKEGASKTLYCVTEGNPKPHVIWTLNGRIIVSDKDRHIYRDYSLKIKPTVENSGTFTCEARNNHGTDKKTVEVKYVVPASVEIPKRSTIDTRVGRNIELECHAGGYPEPTIEWIYRSMEPKVSPKIFKADSSGSLSLKGLKINDDGFYTCNASNIGGETNITYQINVSGPPEIVNVEHTIYRAVEGDLAVRIPCKAIGKPKPVITWTYSGFKIAKGTEFYDIENGTLVVKNVDIKSRGYHLCKATNHLGSDQKYFFLDVSRSPYEEPPSSVVALKEGERVLVNCTLPHIIGSRLRWYKEGRLLSEGELVIDNARAEDSGQYTCRVSTFGGAHSATVEVIVASAPEFQTEPETNIEFDDKSYVELDCTSYAEPAAKTEWYFNGKRVDTDGGTHYFQMQYSNIGEYMCVVSNEVGSINRTFVIKPQGCALHMLDDFTGNIPLMSIPDHDLSIKTAGDYIYIPKNLAFDLSCPSHFTKTPKSKISATCIEDSKFVVDGGVFNFADFKCVSKIQPLILRRGFRCSHTDSELVTVGFKAEGKFTSVYEVCVDKKNNLPIFAKVALRKILSDVNPKDAEWFDSKYVPFDFEAMYNCDKQNVETSRILNRWFRERDSCCFGKRQLVSPKDVMPGLYQEATYSNLNLAAQWSTCNAENWDNLEHRIRSLAKTTDKKLLLWTGQAEKLSLRDSSGYDVNVTITDGGKQQPVPKYLWKVIQDPSARKSLAIVQINIPDLTPEEARRHVLCADVCDRVPWMSDRNWHDVSKGYIYCCGVREFGNAFGYRNTFSRGDDRLLDHVAYISTSSLVI